MYMAGGGGGRVYRGDKPSRNTTRWMAPPKPKTQFSWKLVADVMMGIAYFGILLFTVVVIASCF